MQLPKRLQSKNGTKIAQSPGEIFCVSPPTASHCVLATMGKDEAQNSCNVHISAVQYSDCTLREMRMVGSCQNALSFHGQRNRWPLPFLLPSLHKALNASPMANPAGEMNFSTAEREMNFLLMRGPVLISLPVAAAGFLI